MKILWKIIKGVLIVVLALSILTYLFMQQKSFGKLPSGSRLERIQQSANYSQGSFKNITETKMLADDASYFSMFFEYFKKDPSRAPVDELPVVVTNIKTLPLNIPTIIWFGHSSYLLVINGKRILVDPVFSERASPVQYIGVKGYKGKVAYSIDDFPDIDLVIITHDHYDHLDYGSIKKLRDKAKQFCMPLGVGSHLEHWGIDSSIIKEFDWWESEIIFNDIELIATPARHFSGRGFTRNKTLWASFVLKTDQHTIFIGGDSGYDDSFKTIGNKFGPFDIALLECGQYDKKWPYIHMLPEQTVQASVDLQAKVLFPVHWGKFTLALHPWKEPIERAVKHAEQLQVKVATPKIGETVSIDKIAPVNKWWD